VGSIETLVAKSVSDITGKPFELRGEKCSYYTAKNIASVTDLSSGAVLGAKRNFSVAGSDCTFSSNGLPNHDVGGPTVKFAAVLTASPSLLKVSSAPRAAAATTALSDDRLDAVMLTVLFFEASIQSAIPLQTPRLLAITQIRYGVTILAAASLALL